MPQAHSAKSLVILRAEADSAAVAELSKRLAPLESSGQLRVWDCGDIPPGANREEAIRAALQGADLVAFWVSPDLWHNHPEFDFVCNTPGLIPPTVQGVPIIARHTTWEALPFLKQHAANALPANQQPMPASSKEQEDAWMDDAARSVAQKLGLMKAKPAAKWLFWRKISIEGRITIILTLLAILVGGYLAYPSFVADSRENEEKNKPQATTSPPSDSGCGFPVHFVKDTLYVLITRFEDYENERGLECYGRGIERRIDQLVQSRKMPVVFCYRDDLSPNQSREADRWRDEFHADLIIWGKLRNAGPDCKADGFCLQFNPSGTLIRYASGEVSKPELNSFQNGIAASDIEQGLINMGEERFDDWFMGMFNLKIGKQKPELFVIDERWDRKKRAEAYFTRGNIWAGLDRYIEAIADYDQVIKIDPKDALAYYNRGIAKRKLGRYTEAIADYGLAIKIDPKDALAYYNRGIAKGKLGRHAEAIADYDLAIEIDPKNALAYINRGGGKDNLGHYAEAIADYDQAIEIDPKNALAYINRGYVKRKLSRYTEAIADFDRAIEIDPKDALAYNNRGVAKGNLGRYAEAIADYDLAIEIDPKSVLAYYNRGNAKGNLGRYAESITDYDLAIEIYPKYASAYNNRGVAKGNLGRHAEAIADFDQAIEIDPKDASAYNNRGGDKRKSGRYAESIADYDRAIEIDPKNAAAYLIRGNVKDNLGRHTEAIADYDRAIEIDPKNAAAYNNRGNAKGGLGRHTEAIADYDRVIEIDPKNAVAYYNRGIEKSNLDRYAEAIADYDRSIEIDSKDASAYYNRSFAKQKNGQHLSAFADYSYAIWLDQSKRWVWYLLLVLAVCLWKFKTVKSLIRHPFLKNYLKN